MAHIVGLRLRNFMRFRGEHELTLGPGVWAIIARDEGDLERSNYLGKTALVNAIRWCLEGRVVREEHRVLDEMISYGEGEVAVEIELSDGTFVSRSKKRGKSAELYVSWTGDIGLGEASGEKAQPLIDDRLGISRDDRSTTCFADQGELSSLVRMKSTPLTETVEGWLGTAALVRAGEICEDRLSRVAVSAQRAEEEVRSLETAAGTPEARATLEQRIGELERDLAAEETALREAKRELALYDQRKRCREHADEIERVTREIEEDRKSISDHVIPETLKADLNAKTAILLKLKWEQGELGKLTAGRFDGKCPVSPGFVCPARTEIDDRKVENVRLWELKTKDVRESEVEVGVAREALGEEEREARRQERIRVRIEEMEKQVASRRSKVEDFATRGVLPLEDGPDGELPGEPEIPETTYTLKRDLEDARRSREDREKAASELPTARLALSRLSESLRAHRAALAVLGPEGARRRAVERSVSAIWSDASRRLRDAGVSLEVSADWGRETGSPAKNCPECGTAFGSSARIKSCPRCGATRGLAVKHEFRTRLSHRSGAADDMGGFALRLAAFSWKKAREGFDLSFGFFDEPAASMDRAHRRAMGTHLLRLVAGSELDQVLVISHDSGFLDACPRRIMVTGRGQWSSVEVA